MVTFEADPTQDDTLPLCFCHTSRLSVLPLVFRRALNRRAAFYSGISSAWAQRHLDSINWCLGIRVSFSGCKGEKKSLSTFGGGLGGSFFDRGKKHQTRVFNRVREGRNTYLIRCQLFEGLAPGWGTSFLGLHRRENS